MKKLFLVVLLIAFFIPALFAEDTEPAAGSATPTVAETLSVEDQSNWNLTDDGVKAPDLDRPTVALVLAGGGAKGISHIPIIEALESYGIPIDKVFGTSMGALIGGLYSAGLSPREITDIVKGNDLTNLFTSLDTTGYKEILNAFEFNSNNIISFTLGQGIGGITGLIDDYQVLNFIEKFIGNVPEQTNFDTDLVVPFECNAINMLTGEEKVFHDGSLITAMRASMSLPLVFEPVKLEDGTVLMDGGLVSNYIAHRAYIEGYDIIIVVTLNGYNKNPITGDDYNSFSGVLGSSLSIVLGNTSKGELEITDYLFSPDMTGYGTLSFGAANGILQRGYEEVEAQKAKLEEIASLFTEEQKVYKDPNRVGEYHSKYAVRDKSEYLATSETRHEDLLGRTRISLGLYGSGGYMFYFKPENESTDYTRRVLFPTLSARLYMKNIGVSNFSVDIRLKLNIGTFTEISAMGLYLFTEDVGERVFGLGRLKTTIGSLTCLTDRNEQASLRIVEGNLAADFGVMITNEYNHIFQFYLSADNIWGAWNRTPDAFYGDSTYAFAPSANLEFVYYPNYSNGFFSIDGSRLDLIASIGYNVNNQGMFYKIGFAGENNYSFGGNFSLWLEATAYTACGSPILRSTFMTYGGWDGMPGYSIDIRYRQFIYGGIGFQFNLSQGFAPTFLSFVVRGGVRSNEMYSLSNYASGEYYTGAPFDKCFDGIWDLGLSVGYGIETIVGDIVLGAGINKNFDLALYIELI